MWGYYFLGSTFLQFCIEYLFQGLVVIFIIMVISIYTNGSYLESFCLFVYIAKNIISESCLTLKWWTIKTSKKPKLIF